MNFEEKRLNQLLMNLTKGFSYKDCLAYRKERNWKKYDAMTPIERLMSIVKEVQQYKKGYIEDDYYGEDAGSSSDEIY